MMLFKVSLRPSKIHGLGCFAEEDIPKGKPVWVFDERIDLRIPHSELGNFLPHIREYLKEYGYEEIYEGQKVIVLCGDFSKHMNHSDQPNLIQDEENKINIAARIIKKGEELTCNYFDFDIDAERKLGRNRPTSK